MGLSGVAERMLSLAIFHLYILLICGLIVLQLLLLYLKIIFSLCFLLPHQSIPLNRLLSLLLGLLILLLLFFSDLLLDLVEDLAVVGEISDPTKLGSRSSPSIGLSA